jgi:peptidoglycan/xylan/chitin deacetylase (PgdA/CDA1 family)
MPPKPARVDRKLTRRMVLAAAGAAIAAPAFAAPDALVEPRMRLLRTGDARPAVALTLDACPGAFDPRIASVLVEADVPATIFVCGAWMRRNPDALAFLLAHPGVFSLQNHGARHLTCVLGARRLWGLTPAGDLAHVQAEVEGGARAIAEATGRRPTWFRGAAAIYSPAALDQIRRMGFAVAAYSVNGDGGATLPAAAAAAGIGGAVDGDVVIAHINQPRRAAGAGVARGILALRARGVGFVRLDALGSGDVAYGAGPLS